MDINEPKSINRQLLCPVYESFFNHARRIGILPYRFDVYTLEITPVNSGWPYFLFLFNLLYMLVGGVKAVLLFFQNWRTNFEEDIPGGYFIQLTFIMGHILLIALICGHVFNRKSISSAVTSAIQIESKILQGKLQHYAISGIISQTIS
jgi:hypothetical protein